MLDVDGCREMAGDARYTDTRADEAERGVTIKSTGVSLSAMRGVLRVRGPW